jgi:hypothetical protein
LPQTLSGINARVIDMSSQISKSVHWVAVDHEGHGNPEYGQVETWSCGEHGHESESAAEACIQEKKDAREKYFLSLKCVPIKKIEVIEKVYWDCGHPDHKHVSEYIAKNCIIDGKNKPKQPARRPTRTREAISEMCMNILAGESFKSEGKKIGVGGERAQQIFNQTKRMIFHPKYNTSNDDGSIFKNIDDLYELRKNKKAVECFRQRMYRWECEEK